MNTVADEVLYRERLTPGVGLWLGALGLGLATFMVGAPISIWAGIVAGIIMMILALVVLYVSAPTIEVTRRWLKVGRAQIEREFVGEAEAFRGEDARIVAGPALDGRAFMCFRGWIQPKVRIHITDPADPTPYWLASSRAPEKIVEALAR